MQVHAILPAAGLGTRMAVPGVSAKQFLSLAGTPVLIHSIRAFAAVPRVASIVVAVRPAEQSNLAAQLQEYGLAERVLLAAGGDHRQATVSNALRALRASDEDIVLVHDAVRPLIDAVTIERTIDAVAEFGAAIVALPAVDTIKQVERTAHGAIITSTIPRERIVQAQTPQGATFAALHKAFTDAEADSFQGTDEASLLERAGFTVAVVPGSPANFKITQPGDLELADFYLRGRVVSVQMSNERS